jgi:NitT/TauT family transport system ATP-binding protein
MTTRPATIKLVFDVELQRPRQPRMLFSREYLELKRRAAESIHEEARKAFERGEREQA